MSSISRAGIHGGEVAGIASVRSHEGRAGVSVSPSVTTVGGLVDEVVTVEVGVAAILIHASDVDGACGQVACDLDVANEWGAGVQLSLVSPGRSVVGRIADE